MNHNLIHIAYRVFKKDDNLWLNRDINNIVIVRPGTAGLLIGIECSRVRHSSWMYLTFLVTTRIGVELAAV